MNTPPVTTATSSRHGTLARQCFNRGIRRACQCLCRHGYEFLLKPRHSTDEDDSRKERILTVILLGIVMLLGTYETDLIFNTARSMRFSVSIIPYSTLTGFFVALYVAARKGYWRYVSDVTVIAYFCATVYGSYAFGASMPIGLLSYGLVIAIAGITIDSRAGIVTAVASCASIIFTGMHEISTGEIAVWKQSSIEMHNIIEYGIMLGLTAFLSWLSHKEIERSLARARVSEALLKEERDNLETAVQRRTAELQQAEHQRLVELQHLADFGKVSAGAFHDLLNPLTAVAMTVADLEHEPNQKAIASAKNTITLAIAATQHMQSYIENLREKMRSRAAKESIDIEHAIGSMLTLLQYQIRHANISCEVIHDHEHPLPELIGSRTRFEQILSNLIINAIEAMERSERKQLTVRTSFDSGVLDISDARIRITVTDTGCGMTADTKARVFESFFTTKEHGVGLGLANTKDSIENEFSGTIACESTLGKGTTFTVTLPCHT